MAKKENTVKQIIVTAAKEATSGVQDAIQKADEVISDKIEDIDLDETRQTIASTTEDIIDAVSPHAERIAKAVGTGASMFGNALADGAKSALRQIDKAAKNHKISKTGYYEILMTNSPNERTFTLDGKPLYSTMTNSIARLLPGHSRFFSSKLIYIFIFTHRFLGHTIFPLYPSIISSLAENPTTLIFIVINTAHIRKTPLAERLLYLN